MRHHTAGQTVKVAADEARRDHRAREAAKRVVHPPPSSRAAAPGAHPGEASTRAKWLRKGKPSRRPFAHVPPPLLPLAFRRALREQSAFEGGGGATHAALGEGRVAGRRLAKRGLVEAAPEEVVSREGAECTADARGTAERNSVHVREHAELQLRQKVGEGHGRAVQVGIEEERLEGR